MMKKVSYIFLFLFACSCKQKLPYGKPVVNPDAVLKDQMSFVNYWASAMNLSCDFIALNDSSKQISKADFYRQIATGNYLPVLLNSDSTTYYQLYKMNDTVDHYISTMLKGIGSDEYDHFLWEDKQLPSISFKDLNGKKYDSESMKGKIIVFDFWYIGCTACVHEMPKLNAIVNEYKNRKDILFAAVAFNKENDLKAFMKKINFDFDIISDTTSYLNKKLDITSYPTQLIIDKKGRVVKILDDQYHTLKNLQAILKKEVI
jgi:thiol-disulfide isomerase/thioredoxin